MLGQRHRSLVPLLLLPPPPPSPPLSLYIYIYLFFEKKYTHPGEGVYHICIFIFIFQIVAHAKTTVNTSFFWIHYVSNISIAIICLKAPKNAKPESGSPFSEIPPKNEDLLQEFWGSPLKNQENCIFQKTKFNIRPSQNVHRPKIPKNPDEQSGGFMHRPKIPMNPAPCSSGFLTWILHFVHRDSWQSSKKSLDSRESWACTWILHFVHRDSSESWACAGFVPFSHFKSIFALQNLYGPKRWRFRNIIADHVPNSFLAENDMWHRVSEI